MGIGIGGGEGGGGGGSGVGGGTWATSVTVTTNERAGDEAPAASIARAVKVTSRAAPLAVQVMRPCASTLAPAGAASST